MQLMKLKRIGIILIAAVMMGLVMAPLGLGLKSNTAQAADPTSTPFFDGGSGSEFVCIALPIFSKGPQGSCQPGEESIDNTANGGVIIAYLKMILKLLNVMIGGIIVLVIVIAGIQYIISGGDPANVKKAKGRIMNAITALVLYLLMEAILSFLVPGGIL